VTQTARSSNSKVIVQVFKPKFIKVLLLVFQETEVMKNDNVASK